MRRFASLLCAGALLLPATALHAQAGYPNRPIRLIVPYPPGAGTDIIARTVGQKLGEILGQQIVIDNRGGGGGVIGADAGAKAPPDGYTMVLVTSTFAMTPTLQKAAVTIRYATSRRSCCWPRCRTFSSSIRRFRRRTCRN